MPKAALSQLASYRSVRARIWHCTRDHTSLNAALVGPVLNANSLLSNVCADPSILLHSFVTEVQRGNVSVKTELIPRVTGK